MIPQTHYRHRIDEKRSDGSVAPDRTVPRTISFGQRISSLAADGKELHAPVFDENKVVTVVTHRVIADERRMTRTRDTRITGYEPLLSPVGLLDELPLSEPAGRIVEQSRAEVRAVLDGSDDRLLVIAGPCSVHDTEAALEYAGRLQAARERGSIYPDGIDTNPGLIMNLSPHPQSGLNPATYPVDPQTCQPIQPWDFLGVNTIFQVIHNAGMRTAWSDKHAVYTSYNGPGSNGESINDFFGPEIDSQAVEPNGVPYPVDGAWTDDNAATRQYDSYKVQAV
jgi:DAHP synthetase I family